MSEYRLDIVGNINLSDYSSIHDYMGVIQRNDKFTIISQMKNTEETKRIYTTYLVLIYSQSSPFY